MKPSLPTATVPARPETIVHRVIDACADCDTCRFLMNEDCLFFPALYRLVDREAATGRAANDRELRQLTQWCTLCGLCPCPKIRNEVIRAKSAYVHQRGMPFGHRLLADVQRFGQMGAVAPMLFNEAMLTGPLGRIVKRLVGIHPERRFPRVPKVSFFAWARRKGLCRIPDQHHGVAYFAGCSAGYLFPEVARAAVTVLQCNRTPVYVPNQQCCGMPTLVEGDWPATRRRVQANLDDLLAVRRMGHDLVCSCPTCGFLMKVLLKEGAYHSDAYQQSVGAGANEIKIPEGGAEGQFLHLNKALYGKMLQDDGLFHDLDPLDRISLSGGLLDVGEYLLNLLDKQRLNVRFDPLESRMAYFTPCHQREQKVGNPYARLLALIPGLIVEQVGGTMDCCGMGGSLGFKKAFHASSVALGTRLVAKITACDPQAVITDCLSCRLQLQHLTSYAVFHPLEILARACKGAP